MNDCTTRKLIERSLNARIGVQSRDVVANRDDGGKYVTVVALRICPSTLANALRPRDKGGTRGLDRPMGSDKPNREYFKVAITRWNYGGRACLCGFCIHLNKLLSPELIVVASI